MHADDQELSYRIYASTRTEELAVVPWDDAQKEAFLRMQFDAQHHYYHQQFPRAAYSVILCAGTPAGRLYVDRRADALHIIDIALLPQFRGAGIGTQILRDLLAEADQAGQPVRIHVEQFNPALRLYQRLGFQPAGSNGVYFLMEHPPTSAAPVSHAS
jgi:ribosomal protein S18 acetylase RimI-like enzyme